METQQQEQFELKGNGSLEGMEYASSLGLVALNVQISVTQEGFGKLLQEKGVNLKDLEITIKRRK